MGRCRGAKIVEKVRDIVGLYLDPPERAVVLCVDEKSQIQALDRTQPLLPMRPGQVERRTHDYERHGTTTLFAALVAATHPETDVKAGTIIGKCMPRHRVPEFRKFLDEVEHNVPTGFDIHVVMDNAELETAIHAYIAGRNTDPQPFRWTKSADEILASIERFCRRTLDVNVKAG